MPDEPQHDDSHSAEPTAEEKRPYSFAKGTFRPPQLVAVAVLAALEGLALCAVAIWWGYEALFGSPTDQNLAIMGAVFVLLAGALLVRMGVALWNLDVWPRAPLIVLNLPAVPIGYSVAFRLGHEVIGMAVMAVAIAVIVLLFTQPVKDAFGRDV